MNDDSKQVLNVIRQALERPGSKHKLVANALPSSNGEYWTAILISTPSDLPGVGGKLEVSQNTQELGMVQNLRGNPPSKDDEQRHSGLVCHSTDTEALLGLCHHLLLDAIFCLWSYSDSLK
jgi:hypothetical protein